MFFLFAIVSLVLAACSTGPAVGDSQRTPSEKPLDSPQSVPQTTLQSKLIAKGEFSLSAASAFGDAGFHAPIQLGEPIVFNGGSTSGWTLSVLLIDLGRPGQTCSSEHPLSGCATVDWSDAENRPSVPAGGVFDNSLRLALSSGDQVFYLSESGNLEAGPDAFDPG